MHDSLDPQPLTRPRHARLLAVAILVGAVLAAGCGAASRTTTMLVLGGDPATATSTSSAAAASPTPGTGGLLAFAKCMRSHGVPNFPDPVAGGNGFEVGPGLDRSAPAFKAAQADCQKLMPLPGGLGAPGGPKFSEASLVRVRKAAVCMRRHGITQFPDPTTSRPPTSAISGAHVITDFDGAFLVFPSTLDMDSPAYLRAAAACGTLATKLGKPH